MIKLFQYVPCWDLPNASPFCMKVETFLRMAKLPYELVLLSDPRKTPSGKLPYIQDKEETICDSHLIIRYLIEKYDLQIDAGLTAHEKAMALAMQRLIEEHLYWVLVYSRWIESSGWELTRKAYFGSLPKPLRLFVPGLVRKGIKRALHEQGIGRHSREEIYRFGIEDLAVIKNQLEQHEFLLDSKHSTSVDASAYAFIANILYAPVESPIKEYIKQYEIFAKYCTHMKELYFSDEKLQLTSNCMN